MRRITPLRLYACTLLATATLLGTALPARAQFTPRSVGMAPVGQTYHIEGAIGIWSPGAQMSISSESLGIPGDIIDFKKDLGLEDASFRELHATLRPAKRHKLRYQYIPIKYTQTATVTRQIKFNGQLYTVGVPVTSALDWRAHRFGYEFDFVSRDRGFGGFVLDVKYTDVLASLESTKVRIETAHARAPIPAVGGIFRVNVIPNLAITGEITGFAVPANRLLNNATGHYVDTDFYGTYNFTNYVGAQLGYRSFNVGYAVDEDTGDFKLKGLYFGAVVRY